MGSIRKRGKTYTIFFDIGKDANGKRRQKTKGGFKNKKDAKMKLIEYEAQVHRGEFINDTQKTVKEFLEEWLHDYVYINLSKNSITGYETNVKKHIIPALGNVKLFNLKPVQLQKFYTNQIESGLSGTTVLYIHRVLHKAMNYAVQMQYVSKNVADYVTPPKKNTYHPHSLKKEDVKNLLVAAKDTDIYIPVLLMVSLGLRRGEALGLQWKAFDKENKSLLIEKSANRIKGGMELADVKTFKSHRSLYLSESLINLLEDEYNRQENERKLFGKGYNPLGLIVCRIDGRQMTTNYLDKQFRKILLDHQLPFIRLHDLRHTNATLLLEQNIPSKIVSERLGHSSISVTCDIYQHVNKEMQKDCANVLDDLL